MCDDAGGCACEQCTPRPMYASVLESADKEDSKSFASNGVWVQVPPEAPEPFCRSLSADGVKKGKAGSNGHRPLSPVNRRSPYNVIVLRLKRY